MFLQVCFNAARMANSTESVRTSKEPELKDLKTT